MKIKIFKEKAGVISRNPCWVAIEGGCYLYVADSFFGLLWLMLTEWRHDRHIA